MPLTPECVVRIAARRRSHNELTAVTHSKIRADAVNTIVVPTARQPICDNLFESPPTVDEDDGHNPLAVPL